MKSKPTDVTSYELPALGNEAGRDDSFDHPMTCGRWVPYLSDQDHKRYVPEEVCTCKGEEAEAIEAILDCIQPGYPNLTRDELRETFHTTFDRLAPTEGADAPEASRAYAELEQQKASLEKLQSAIRLGAGMSPTVNYTYRVDGGVFVFTPVVEAAESKKP